MEEGESEVVAVLLEHLCGARLLLRRGAAPLDALAGFPLFGLTVDSYAELLRWQQYFTAVDVEHSGVHQPHLGWVVTVTTPYQVRIQPHRRGTQRRRRVGARVRCYLALMKTGFNAVGGCDRPVESVAGDGLR